jgi:hypothetical protein
MRVEPSVVGWCREFGIDVDVLITASDNAVHDDTPDATHDDTHDIDEFDTHDIGDHDIDAHDVGDHDDSFRHRQRDFRRDVACTRDEPGGRCQRHGPYDLR